MKFNKLFEQDEPVANLSATQKKYLEYIELIKRNCGRFLDREKHLIYRGIHGQNNFFVEKDIRTDRSPKDTMKDMNTVLNEVFDDLFGIEDLRNNVLFASRDILSASEYGNSNIIFVQGDYDIISGEINDLYTDITRKPVRFIWGGLNKMISSDELLTNFSQDDHEVIKIMFDVHGDRETELFFSQMREIPAEYKDISNKLKEYTIQCLKEIFKESYDYEKNGPKQLKNELMIVPKTVRKYYAVDAKKIRQIIPATDAGVLATPEKLINFLEKFIKQGHVN